MEATSEKDKGKGLPQTGAAPSAAPAVNPFAGASRGPRLPGNGAPNNPFVDDDDIELDCTDVSMDGLVYDEGIHPAKLIGFEKVDSKSSSGQNFEWEFRFIGGKHRNNTIKTWTSLSPAARWKIVQFLSAFGIDAAGEKIKFKPSDLIGKPVDIEVYHDDYNNPKTKRVQKTSKVDQIYPPSDETMRLFHADSPIPKAPA